jgi:hypothetical protein
MGIWLKGVPLVRVLLWVLGYTRIDYATGGRELDLAITIASKRCSQNFSLGQAQWVVR